jgi:MoxR-like ATPase
MERRAADVVLQPVVDRDEFLAMQLALEDVYVAESVGRYMVALVAATRHRAGVEVGASPRGSLALLTASRAHAVLAGRDFVVPEDVKAVALPALAHRLRLRPDLWVRGVKPDDVVDECLREVPTPAPEEARRR